MQLQAKLNADFGAHYAQFKCGFEREGYWLERKGFHKCWLKFKL